VENRKFFKFFIKSYKYKQCTLEITLLSFALEYYMVSFQGAAENKKNKTNKERQHS
jgi:hypothetical protein